MNHPRSRVPNYHQTIQNPVLVVSSVGGVVTGDIIVKLVIKKWSRFTYYEIGTALLYKWTKEYIVF